MKLICIVYSLAFVFASSAEGAGCKNTQDIEKMDAKRRVLEAKNRDLKIKCDAIKGKMIVVGAFGADSCGGFTSIFVCK